MYGNRAVLDIGDKDNPNALALQIQGSDVLASDSLYARIIGNVDISSAVDTRVERGNSKSSGYTTGVGVSFAGDGVTVSAQTSAFASKGNSSGTDLENHYSHFGGQNLTVFDISGDLNMLGGVIIGDRIAGKIGGDLTIVSPQDISIYRSQQTSGSVGASIGWNLNTWSPRGGINASVSQENVKSNTVSVGDEKAGIKAGDGGFNITVGGGTHLVGAAISSSQEAVDKGLNFFSTNGLWLADLENRSSSNASSTSMSLGYSPGSGFKGLTGGVPVVMSSSDSDQSTTVAGISGGTIINNGTQVAVDSTGRPIDTAVRTGDASGKVENVLDLDKIKSEFAIGKTLSQEAGTFLNYRAQEADAAEKRFKKEEAKGSEADLVKLAQYAKEAEAAAPWGPGGTYRLVFTAVTSALSGNMSGSAAQAMQSAMVTTLQGLGASAVKGIADEYEKGAGPVKGEALRTALQAIVGCAGAAASGGSCAAGALGASASVVVNNLVDLATNTKASDLTAQEKESRMNLINSLLGGVTTALGGDAAAATLAARVEQENNCAVLLLPLVPPTVLLIERFAPGILERFGPEVLAELPAIAQRLEAGAVGLVVLFSELANGVPDKEPEDKFATMLDRIDKKGSPPPFYKGGKIWKNDGRGGAERLPERDAAGNKITYKEWDVDPRIPGQDRGIDRLVTGSNGSAYKTMDHYMTFIKMR
ncbi:MAG: hemagglutinin repeat-containing protein [Solidesulfovibrio sp.]